MRRAEHSGSIYVRGDALWIGYYKAGWRRESVGKLLGKPPHKTTWKDAQDCLTRQLELKIVEKEKGPLTSPRDEKLTVAQLVDRYLDERINVAGIKAPDILRWGMAGVTTWYGDLPAAKLTEAQLIERIKAQRAHGAKPSTIWTRLGRLRTAVTWGRKYRLRLIEPVWPTITVARPEPVYWTAAEIQAVCAQLPEWAADIVRFGSLTGWRIMEVLPLTWDRVDLKAGLMLLNKTKMDIPRRRPLEPALLALFQRRHAGRVLGCPLVFHTDGVPVGDGRFYRQWHRALHVCGLPRRRFHSFRSHAYDGLLDTETNLRDAMDLVGHKSLSSAMRYIKPSVARQREALKRRDAAGGGA